MFEAQFMSERSGSCEEK